jgi:hypothetical protein
VEEAVDLLVDRLDDAGMVVTHVGHPDAADEVDERIAVDVRDRRSARLGRDDGRVDDERPRDRVRLPLEDLPRPGSGNLRAELDHSGRRHAREGTCRVVRRSRATKVASACRRCTRLTRSR